MQLFSDYEDMISKNPQLYSFLIQLQYIQLAEKFASLIVHAQVFTSPTEQVTWPQPACQKYTEMVNEARHSNMYTYKMYMHQYTIQCNSHLLQVASYPGSWWAGRKLCISEVHDSMLKLHCSHFASSMHIMLKKLPRTPFSKCSLLCHLSLPFILVCYSIICSQKNKSFDISGSPGQKSNIIFDSIIIMLGKSMLRI